MAKLTQSQRERICHKVLGKPTIVPAVQIRNQKLLHWWTDYEYCKMPTLAPRFDRPEELGLILEAMTEESFEFNVRMIRNRKRGMWEVTFGVRIGISPEWTGSHPNLTTAAALAALKAVEG